MDEFARSAVEVQRQFDRAVQPSDAALGVPRMRIPTLTVDARVSVAVGRTKGFSLSVCPINLGFQVTHEVKSETFSRFQITIEQTVLTKPVQNT
ncbi:MAG: hypothetical protein NTV70_22735 [Acidobacteria bacterium]|nr:hypothetical protein [Acidobacteriota bacterium]